MKKIIQAMKGIKNKVTHEKKGNMQQQKTNDGATKIDGNNTPDYFTLATSWADDFYISVEASRNRWKAMTLWVMLPFCGLLLICMTFLIPSQRLVPLIVDHYDNGMVTVTPFNQPYAPENQAQVESDIAKYVTFRESYSADTYDYSYRLVDLLSSHDVSSVYERQQSTLNKDSPINTLGNRGFRSVKIESIVFLDDESKNTDEKGNNQHRNLAQINFVVTEHDKNSESSTSEPMTALISWGYKGIPKNPEVRWMDWNGFTVNLYQLQQRND